MPKKKLPRRKPKAPAKPKKPRPKNPFNLTNVARKIGENKRKKKDQLEKAGK